MLHEVIGSHFSCCNRCVTHRILNADRSFLRHQLSIVYILLTILQLSSLFHVIFQFLHQVSSLPFYLWISILLEKTRIMR